MVFVSFIRYSNEDNLHGGSGIARVCVCDVILMCVWCDYRPLHAYYYTKYIV